MKTILTLDTSTPMCSVALSVNGRVDETHSLGDKQHSQIILPMIDEILKRNNLALDQLDGVGVTIGPGSFTGLRIGVGVAQGVAFGAEIPVVGVSTLATLAQGAHREFGATNILPALDARMNQVYWGEYRIDEQGIARAVVDDQISDPDAVRFSDESIGVGSGWKVLQQKPPRMEPDFFPQAQDIIPLALEKFEQGGVVSAAALLPVYLRKPI